jgi:uncharacterized protein
VSYSIDANILIYASDELNPRHDLAVTFLQERAADPEPCHLAWPALMAYVRIVTHPSIFAEPLTLTEALDNVGQLLSLAHVTVLTEQAGFLATYREVVAERGIRGNLVPDAHLAAILRQHGVARLYSCDRDFRRFSFLDVVDPLG